MMTPRRDGVWIAGIVALAFTLQCPIAGAADFFNFTASALKAPDCITDAAPSFFSQNVQPVEPPHPTLPIGRYYMIVRYLGADSVSFPTAFDYGRFPSTVLVAALQRTAVDGTDGRRSQGRVATHPGARCDAR